MSNNRNIEIFNSGFKDNLVFWKRFNNQSPNFNNKNVLDIGCGWGSMVVDIANQGADFVMGVDINCNLINFAQEHVKNSYKDIKNRISFECVDLRNFNNQNLFDIIISKDAFEHIMDLQSMLKEMSQRLKEGGKIYLGFGPLFHSPYGDHDRRKRILKPLGILGKLITKLPWGHLFFSKKIIKLYNNNNKEITSFKNLQLNMLKYSDYINIFNNSGLKIKYLKYNQSDSSLSGILSLLSNIPGLKNYCVHNIYCILEKPIIK